MPIRTYSFLQGNIPAEKGNGGVIIAFLHTAVTDLIGKYRSAALKDLTTILKCNKHRLIHTSFILPFSEQEYSSLQNKFARHIEIIRRAALFIRKSIHGLRFRLRGFGLNSYTEPTPFDPLP